MHSTDLPALLQILQNSRHSGRVCAQVPYGFAGLSGGYAFVDFAQGRTVACYLLNAQKQIILTGNEAMNVISSMGVLQWTPGQEFQQTNTSTNHLPAIRPNPTSPQYTNTAIPVIRQYSSGKLYTNPQVPAMRQYPTDPQYTNPRISMSRPSSSADNHNPHTTVRLNDPYPPAQSTNTPPLSNYPFSAFVPERRIHIDTNLLGNLARRLRRVLVLVDGQRSIMKISLILHANNDGQRETFSALKQLEEMNLIVIKKP